MWCVCFPRVVVLSESASCGLKWGRESVKDGRDGKGIRRRERRFRR